MKEDEISIRRQRQDGPSGVKIIVVSTEIKALRTFFSPQLKRLSVSNDLILVGQHTESAEFGERLISVKIIRRPSIIKDILALIQLIFIIWREKPDIIITMMPKAGFIGQIAAYICAVRTRIHVFTGQVWASKAGLSYLVLKFFDNVIGLCATDLVADGKSQMKFLIEKKVVNPEKICTLGDGSICGVDLYRFLPKTDTKYRIRSLLGIKETATVFIFVGRLCEDKGVGAFLELATKMPSECEFLIIGPDEGFWEPKIDEAKKINNNIHYLGFRKNVEDYMSASDILVLPSRREGFGNVVIEAGACGLAVLGSDIYGLSDSLQNNVNGLTYPLDRNDCLYEEAVRLHSDKNLRNRLAKAGLFRSTTLYDQQRVVNLWLRFLADRH